jgi:hypothetical protein
MFKIITLLSSEPENKSLKKKYGNRERAGKVHFNVLTPRVVKVEI